MGKLKQEFEYTDYGQIQAEVDTVNEHPEMIEAQIHFTVGEGTDFRTSKSYCDTRLNGIAKQVARDLDKYQDLRLTPRCAIEGLDGRGIKGAHRIFVVVDIGSPKGSVAFYADHTIQHSPRGNDPTAWESIFNKTYIYKRLGAATLSRPYRGITNDLLGDPALQPAWKGITRRTIRLTNDEHK
ncbi:hypothetical protein [Haloglycomyces albus]|uniref:hypothetical protein n=1 Tax=Haloglycomyces albus TaxID=526067 RepID=UPI00046CEF99|nr:hypothetical protein [Haloglycomyces albus]